MGMRIASPFSLITNRSGNEALPASFCPTTKSPAERKKKRKRKVGKFDAGIDR